MELSRRGANIVLNYPYSKLEEEANEVGNQLQTPWIAVCADLSTIQGPSDLVAAAVERFGLIHILVNNAARVPQGPTWTVEADTWDETFALNVRGVFLLTKAVLPHLPPYKPSDPPEMSGVKGGSRIVCIGSGAGRLPQPNTITYAATKGALDTMIKVWARELPPVYGCTVNGIAPGPVDTKTYRTGAGDHLDEMNGIFSSLTPVEGSLADVEDVSWAVAFLVEDRSKWINGEYINVSGGLCIV